MNFPYLPLLRDKALLSFLSSISSSSDILVKEASILLDDEIFLKRQSMPQSLCPLLRAAKDSVNSMELSDPAQSSKLLKSQAKKCISVLHASRWNNQLERLEVQSKFKDIISLESDCPIWNRIVLGLPSGQLSFILRAGSVLYSPL